MRTSSWLRRRRLIQGAGAMVPLGLMARAFAAGPASAFDATSLAEALGALGGAPVPSASIGLNVSPVADDGSAVPVTVASALPGTRELLLLVDTNPQPMVVQFTIPPGTEPFVATRIRMAGNGTVYAMARTDDGLYAARRAVEVSVGGCG